MNKIFESLKSTGGFKGEIKTDKETLTKFSRDASIFEVVPSCVVSPIDQADLEFLVKFVSENKKNYPELSITARSAGTDMSGGTLGESIIADFTSHFGKILSVESNQQVSKLANQQVMGKEITGFATVEPGVFYRDFEKKSKELGMILPCYTASKSLNTVGGMVANNSAGEKSLSYGQTKDYVDEVTMVMSNGESLTFGELDEHALDQKLKLTNFEGDIYRKTFRLINQNLDKINKAKPTTSKNSAGYLLWEVWNKSKTKFNLARLITGSQGTLGLITKVKVKLVTPKPKSELLVIFMNDLKNLGDVVSTVVNYQPESFESFDDHTFKLAMKFFPDMLKRMKGNLIKLGFQFIPELWMTITGGVPKLILIAEFTGDTEVEIYQKMLMAEKEIKSKFKLKTHITKNAEEAEKYWTVRRESFSLLRQHTHGLSTAPFIDDIVVHPKELPVFLPELNKILDKYPSLIYTIAGHAGDANFHIIPLMDLTREDQREIVPILSDEVYNLVLKYKGSITAEHNDGLIRSPYLLKMYGVEITNLFAEVKQIFDPQNIFNPGKKVGSSLEYAMSHIKRTL